jgi:RimJ/RimL family protein N-acetyltransferase
VPFDEKFRDLSWEWLNDKELGYLTQTAPFTRQAQLDWFAGLPNRNDYLIWGVQSDQEPIGAFGLKGTSHDVREYWGYIGNRMYWGRGIGKRILEQAIERAAEMGVQSLCLRVLSDNVRAIRLYLNYGFMIYDFKEGSILMRRQVSPQKLARES